MLLKFAIKDFLADRRFRNLSVQPIESYERTLMQFHSCCVEREIVNEEETYLASEDSRAQYTIPNSYLQL